MSYLFLQKLITLRELESSILSIEKVYQERRGEDGRERVYSVEEKILIYPLLARWA